MSDITDRLTERLLEDRKQRAEKSAYEPNVCLVCERTYTTPVEADAFRFCSVHCREAYDTGSQRGSENSGLHPDLVPNLFWLAGWKVVAGPPGLEADLIAHCDHKRRGKVRAKTPDLIRPQRQCECCGGNIPNWQGVGKARRKTKSNVRFCSKKCSKIGPSRSALVPEATNPRSQLFGPSTPPLNLIGGYRWPGAPQVELETR